MCLLYMLIFVSLKKLICISCTFILLSKDLFLWLLIDVSTSHFYVTNA